MHLTVQRQLLDHFTPVGLEGAPVIVQRHAGGRADNQIGDPRREAAREPGVAALPAPSAHHIVSLVQFPEQQGDVGRIVLEVPVERHDDIAARLLESGRDRGGLAEIATEENHGHLRRPRKACRLETLRGAVYAAVVDVDNFPGQTLRVHRCDDLGVERVDVLPLIVEGHHD